MEQNTSFVKVPIRPIDCLNRSMELVKGQYWLFVGICLVGLLIGGIVPLGILLGPMMAGIFLCLFAAMRGQKISFDHLFRGFDHFIETLIATMILMGVMLVLIAPCYFVMLIGTFFAAGHQGNGAEPGAGFAAVLGVMALFYLFVLAISFLVGLLFCFVYPLIVDRGLKAVPAIKTSAQAVFANLGGMIGLTLLNTLIGMLASLLCYVPVFLVSPVLIGAVAIAYRKVFPEQAATSPGTT
jgi:uncharacterized membrane protein